jgi:hypothetical protein
VLADHVERLADRGEVELRVPLADQRHECEQAFHLSLVEREAELARARHERVPEINLRGGHRASSSEHRQSSTRRFTSMLPRVAFE